MTERGDDIRTTAEQLELDAARLAAIEQAKLELPDGDDRTIALAEEALRLTQEMTKTAKVQLAITVDPAD